LYSHFAVLSCAGRRIWSSYGRALVWALRALLCVFAIEEMPALFCVFGADFGLCLL
jgi:hypothetical protein